MAAWWLAVALMAISWRTIAACSCMPSHPQTHFCDSDFVITARVEKVIDLHNNFDSYRINVRRVFKATEKAQEALKFNRILSPSQESLCKASLEPKETYLLTGRIVYLQAHVNLCNFHAKLRDLTRKQRRGFRKDYGAACACKVRISWNSRRVSRNPNTCLSGFHGCYERHGICRHNSTGKCKWANTGMIRRCEQIERYNGTMT